jgi:uncharacterized protein DUF4136
MKRCVILLAGALFAAACASTEVPPQFAWDKQVSFANLKSYAWYDGPPFKYPNGGAVADGRFIDEQVRHAVEKELARKGYTKVQGGSPDFFVTYATSQDAVLNQDVYGKYGWWSPHYYAGSNTAVQGTLAIDVRNPDKKLVWRGMLSGATGKNPEQLAEKIDRSVAELLEKFPPSATTP